MVEGKVTSVGVLGFDAQEFRLIGNVLRISACRPQGCYELCSGADTRDCDVLIVNADDASSRAKAGEQGAQLLVCSAEPAPSMGHPYCLRPLSPVKLLAVLDQLVLDQQLQEPANQIFAGKKSTAIPGANGLGRLLDASKYIGSPRFRRALVVDDSPTVLKQLELELEASGIHVDAAETGEIGLELVEKNYYDLIFLDVMLPGTDGYQVCRRIKRNPALKRTPVVMLTSKSSPFDRVRGSLAGCDTYLTKPVDYEQFRQVLEKY